MKARMPFVYSIVKILLLANLCWIILCLSGCQATSNGLLNPKGLIAYEERKLFFDTIALMLIVVIPVIIMSLTFVYHYQVSHRIRDYQPQWGHSFMLESLWWGIPCVIIVILSILTWKQSHQLDPFKRITGHTDQTPLLIQAIALPWKWLFIYPQQGIATVNLLVLPVGQPIEYWFTTDNVPMSAFFVPQLGSQIYAMAGMRSRLNLLANEPGVYDGMNTQYNGDGFSDMHFRVIVLAPEKMQEWFANMKKAPTQLDEMAYQELLKPTMHEAPQIFINPSANLFDNVIRLYQQTFGTIHPRENIGAYRE